MPIKHFWQSKTIWINAIALAGMILASITGIELEADTQAALATAILAVINIVLRLITNQAVSR